MERERIRHEMAFRRVQVSARTQLTPAMVRITVTGADLAGFAAEGPSDHVKVYFPDPDTGVVTAPSLTADGVSRPTDAVIISRDFTPRAFRAGDEGGQPELDLDFVLHGTGGGVTGAAGPASAWAAGAKPGDELVIGGPRGSKLAPRDAARAILIADETALPAFSRWLELLPASTRVTAILDVEDDDAEGYATEEQRQRASIEWLYRIDGPGQLEEAVRSLSIPDDAYIWAAGEAAALVPVRRYLRHELGIDRERLAVEGYWKRGVTNLDHHAPIDPTDPD